MSYDEKELLADYKRLLESNRLNLGIIENLMEENKDLKSLCDELLFQLDKTRTAINKAKPRQNVKTLQMNVSWQDCVNEAVKILKSELGSGKQ